MADTRAPGLLRLAGPHTLGSGPTGPSVSLTLPLQVLPAASGRTFTLEVRATDDAGAVQGFEPAGTLTVAGVTPVEGPEPGSAGSPAEDQLPKPTAQARWQHAHTNAGSREDERIEGNVVAVDAAGSPPTVTIADRDGLVVLRLHGDAASVSVKVGDYVSAWGEKVTEQLYDIDDLSPE